GTWPAQVADGIATVPHPWASLDGSWQLSTPVPYRLMPDTEQDALIYHVGWWGTQLAGTGGAFAPPYPTVTVTHAPRATQTLQLVGDSARGEYPVDFTIALYDEADNLLHQEVVVGNTEIEWRKELPTPVHGVARRSEERRVGKEWRFRCTPEQ